MEPTPRHAQRISISMLAAAGLVVGGVLAGAPTSSGRADLPSTYDAQARERAEARAERRPHTHPGGTPTLRTRVLGTTATAVADGHGHIHNDPTTKNAVSRSGEAAAAPDRTTPRPVSYTHLTLPTILLV